MWKYCNGSLKFATTGSLHILPNYTQYARFKEKTLAQTLDVVKTTPVLFSGRSLSA